MQYCWTTLRKRAPLIGSLAPYTAAQPQIEFHGRCDNPQIKEIPITGDHAAFTLIVSGLIREEIDANSVIIEINGEAVLPYYVGPGQSEMRGSAQCRTISARPLDANRSRASERRTELSGQRPRLPEQ